MSEQAVSPAPTGTFKPKKSVALSGTAAGNTALCTVGRSGNDLHYRGYDILDFANTAEFEEIAYLLVHGKLPNKAELAGYKAKLKSLRGVPAAVKAALGFYETVRREGTQKNTLDTLQTRAELYDFLGYHAYEDKLDQLFAQNK